MSAESRRTGRRQFLQLAGVGVLGSLAGCTGGADDGDADDDVVDDRETDDDVVDDGETDDDVVDDGEADDDVVDDGEADDEVVDGGETDDGASDENGGETPQLQDVLVWEHSYVMELGGPLGVGTVQVFEGDTYTAWDSGGVEMEAYRIGGESYIVVDGACYQSVGDSESEIFEPEAVLDASGEIRAAGVETIDGQEVYRFMIDDGYLYVLTETGYPLRFADADDTGLVEFHSWGEVEPITPPDMECVEQ